MQLAVSLATWFRAPFKNASSSNASSKSAAPRSPRLLLGDGQRRFDQIDGISPDHDLVGARLDDAVHVAIQEVQLFETERKLDGFRFAGTEGDAAEASQLFDGPGYGTDFVANIKLYDFVAPHFAGVGDIYADVRRAFGTDRGRCEMQVVVFECRIAESPAERKERERGAAEILALRGRFLIVVVGKLAHRARNGDGQLAAWIVIAEENFGRGGAAFLPEIPAIKNGGNICGEIGDGVGATVEKKHDDRLVCGEDGFGEIVLIAEQREIVAIALVLRGPRFARGLFVVA